MPDPNTNRPKLNKAILQSQIMQGMVPLELRMYASPVYARALEVIKSQDGCISEISLEFEMAKIVQAYQLGCRRRSGPSSARSLRPELEPLMTNVDLLQMQLNLLSSEAKDAFLIHDDLLSMLKRASSILHPVIEEAKVRGRPREAHIARAVQSLADLWEFSHKKPLGKTLDKADGKDKSDYYALGPFFIQSIFEKLDPDVPLASLDTAIGKLRTA